MKRFISWMLVLSLALSLVPAGLAEEFFSEEPFFDAPGAGDESLFFEEGFFGEEVFLGTEGGEDAAPAEEEEDLLDDGLEERSIVSFITDNFTVEDLPPVPTAESSDTDIALWQNIGYWRVKPTLTVEADAKKSDTIVVTVTQESMGVIKDKKGNKVAPTAMPTVIFDDKATVSYFVYAVSDRTGAAYQVGTKPLKPKFDKKTNKFTATGKFTLLEGRFRYFARAEAQIVADKGLKTYYEMYGVSSDLSDVIERYNAKWDAKVAKLAANQAGDYITVTWQTKYTNVDGFEVNGELVPIAGNDSDALIVVGNTFSYELKAPQGYKDGDQFEVTVTPYKFIGTAEEPTRGQSASKKIKLSGQSLLTALTAEEDGSSTAEDPRVTAFWTIPAGTQGKIDYTITGTIAPATLTVEITDNGVSISETGKKTPIGPKNFDAILEPDGSVDVWARLPVKPKNPVKLTFAVAKDGAKPAKTVLNVAMPSLAKPVIVYGGSVNDHTVTLRIKLARRPIKGQTFELSGFATKTTVLRWDGMQFDNAFAEWDEDECAIVYTGAVNAVKKITKVKFAAQPLLGKVKGAKSDAYTVNVWPDGISPAMDIQFKNLGDGVLAVSFTAPGQMKDMTINVSLVAADGEFNPDAYHQIKSLYDGVPEPTAEDWDTTDFENGRYTVTFDGVEEGSEYTAFVEIVSADYGRLVETATCIAGKEVVDPALDEKPDTRELQDRLSQGDGHFYEDEETEPVAIFMLDDPEATFFEKLGDLSMWFGMEADSWKIQINDKWYDYDSVTDAELLDGVNILRFRCVVGGVEGKVSDPVDFTAYRPVKIKEFTGSDKAMATATLAFEITGGSGHYKAVASIEGEAVQTYDDTDGVEVFKVTIPSEAGATTTYTLNATDLHITQNGAAIAADPETHVVEWGIGEDEEGFYYMLASADAKTAAQAGADAKMVQVVGYDDNTVTTLKVPDQVELEGSTYQVIEIGAIEMGTADGVAVYKGAFEGFAALASVELPNQIVIIGVNAFKDCESLATMTCYPNPEAEN